MSLSNMTERIIIPALKKAGGPWHGWHAARRGVSANLNRLGVSDVDIQHVLPHADVETTRKHYIKPSFGDTSQVMSKLENAILDTSWTPASTDVVGRRPERDLEAAKTAILQIPHLNHPRQLAAAELAHKLRGASL